MAVKPILRMGDPRLLQVSAPVREFGTPDLLELISDMNDTMLAANGAGLAAPQIGVLLRVVIFGGGADSALPGRGCRALHGADQSQAQDAAGRQR